MADCAGEIEFDLQTPLNIDIIAGHVAHALSLGLPNTQTRKHLAIVANGPTAKAAPFGNFGMPTLALNGGLRQFVERGLAPTYWAACDPQELVADFLKDAPEETIYLVASKCHPAVFEALKNRRVFVWHVADQIVPNALRAPLCCSITMCAAWEMTRPSFGFTDLQFWGWDASFQDDEHHAGDAAGNFRSRPDYVSINMGGKIIEGPNGPEIEGGRNFETTHTWAAEADFAQQFIQLCGYYDIGLTIHGDGMMAAVQRALAA